LWSEELDKEMWKEKNKERAPALLTPLNKGKEYIKRGPVE
jgi:hypothetical protein